MKVLHSIYQQIWKNSAVATGLEKVSFIPIPKKGNAKECSNYHTIALISHASKVMFGLFSGTFTAVEEVKEQSFVRDIHHIHAIDVDILYHTAASASRFETQANIGTDIEVIAHLDILDAAGHL